MENDLAGETQPEEEEQELCSNSERDGLEFAEPDKEARGEKNSSSSSSSSSSPLLLLFLSSAS